jgi:hypothetical protein
MRIAVIFSIFLPCVVLAQKSKQPAKPRAATASPASKYGNAILVRADSAYSVANDISIRAMIAGGHQATTSYSSARNADFLAFRDTVVMSARVVQRLRGDFDAVEAPQGLGRVHAQVVAGLDSLVASVTGWESSLSRCEDADKGTTSSIFRCIDAASSAMDRNVAARGLYEDARERARRLLRESALVIDTIRKP